MVVNKQGLTPLDVVTQNFSRMVQEFKTSRSELRSLSIPGEVPESFEPVPDGNLFGSPLPYIKSTLKELEVIVTSKAYNKNRPRLQKLRQDVDTLKKKIEESLNTKSVLEEAHNREFDLMKRYKEGTFPRNGKLDVFFTENTEHGHGWFGLTPLHRVILLNDVRDSDREDFVKEVIEMMVDEQNRKPQKDRHLNRPSLLGFTPLALAAIKNMPEIMECLLEAGATPDPLALAVASQVQEGDDPPPKGDSPKKSPAKIILDAMDKRAKESYDPLAHRRQLESLNSTQGGLSALHQAVRNSGESSAKIVEDLIDQNVDVNIKAKAKDVKGATPLHLALTAPTPNQKVINLLVDNKANLYRTANSEMKTPLKLGFFWNDHEVAAHIMEGKHDNSKMLMATLLKFEVADEAKKEGSKQYEIPSISAQELLQEAGRHGARLPHLPERFFGGKVQGRVPRPRRRKAGRARRR
jgi:hypothetical protein